MQQSFSIVFGFCTLLISIFLFWKFIFLRDPDRSIPEGDNIVSPADGKVVAIITFDFSDNSPLPIEKGWLGAIETDIRAVADEGYIISVFMNLFSVHINRMPIEGKILSQKHTPGAFHNASHFPASLIENEKNEILIQHPKMKVKLIQIAGLLVRRIVSHISVGDQVTKGQRIGLINFGSQCTVVLPKEGIEILVQEGDHVHGGTSILATYTYE